jgi:RNA polymerase sigma-70 factor (ECF subfamily)
MSAPTQSEGGTGAREFTTTHWSAVLSAGRDSSAQASDALAKLCRVYWWPMYAYVRRQGHSPHDAQDLTQAFFARLLEKNYLSAVDPRKGLFRSFLLAALCRESHKSFRLMLRLSCA